MESNILINLGEGGHICHNGQVDPFPMFGHSLRCPTGEHTFGWQHVGGPHAMCPVCQPQSARGGAYGSIVYVTTVEPHDLDENTDESE